MTSGDLLRLRIDDTFAEVLGRCPADVAADAVGLPCELGLVRPGENWEHFIITDVNRDLPRYAAESGTEPGRSTLSSDSLRAFRRAHHCGIIYGLIVDRIEDGQRASTPKLRRLRRVFKRAWIDTLTEATGDGAFARRLVVNSLRSLRAGNTRERQALAIAQMTPGRLTPPEYVRFTLAKLRWFGTSADALLVRKNEGERHRAFRRAYDTFSIALQCIDDALDESSDRETRGASFPSALGFPPGGFLVAASGLMSRAGEIARRAGFTELGRWFGHVANTLATRPVAGDPLEVGITAQLLCAAAEEATGA